MLAAFSGACRTRTVCPLYIQVILIDTGFEQDFLGLAMVLPLGAMALRQMFS